MRRQWKSAGLLALMSACGGAPRERYVPQGGPPPKADAGAAAAPALGCPALDGGPLFEMPKVAATDPGPWFVAAADLNGDGIPDLAVANGGVAFGGPPRHPGSSMTLLFGNGDGSFRPGVPIPTEPGTVSVLAGDFAGSGKPQLLVGSCDESPDGGGGAIQLFDEQPNGLYAGEVPYPLDACPFATASGDFNGDGRLDVAAATPGPFGGSADGGAIVVLYSHAETGLQFPIRYPTPAAQWAVASVDVNGDGKPDLLSLGADSTLTVLLNEGDGVFRPLAPQELPKGPWESLAVADFDGDGRPDIAAISTEQGALLVAFGMGDGAFAAPAIAPTDGYPVTVVAADFDGDGAPDIAVAYDSGFFDGADLFLNRGGGVFGPAQPLLTAAGGFGAAVADFDRDGRPDLAVTDNYEGMVSVLLNGCAAPEAPDAGPFVEAGHDPIPLVPANGGPVLASPALVTVHFQDDPSRAHNEAFDGWIAGSQWLAQVGSSYGVGPGTHRAAVVLPKAAPTQMTDQDIQQMLLDEIDAGVLPPPQVGDGGSYDTTDIYMVYLPEQTTVSGSNVGTSCRDFGGYHSEDDLGPVDFAYAVLPFCYGDQTEQDISASHELIEGSTDPFPFTDRGYVQSDFGDPFSYLGGEIGDLCTSTAVQEGDYVVQRIWSNDAADAGTQPCVPAPEGPYFNVSPAPGNVLQASAGQDLTVKLTAWSTGPTAPWAIRFLPSYGGFGGTGFFVPEVSFDRVVVGNGDSATMTIHVPSDVNPQGFSAFALYMGHGDGDQNGGYWPFLVTLNGR